MAYLFVIRCWKIGPPFMVQLRPVYLLYQKGPFLIQERLGKWESDRFVLFSP